MRSASFFHILLLLALVPAPLAAGTDTPPIVLPMDRIIPPLPDGDFGRSMDIAGDLAVIGAPHFVVGDRGEVHVYRRIGPLWVQEAKITPEGYQWPTILDGDWTPVMFGAAVAAGPDTVAIGAPSYFSTPNGTVFVYHRSGGVWSLQATLQEPAPATSAFGSTLDLEGDTLVVGGANRAYVYTRSAGVWSHRVLLAPPSGASFARQVAIDGDTIVAGSPGEESGKGAAYVFTGGGTAWSLQARIVASGLQPLDYFGTRIAIDGSTIVVGAPDTDYLRGAAYVFVRQGTSWAQQAKLLDPGPTRYPELFGHSLSIAGDTVVAGAVSHGLVFTRSAGQWTSKASLMVPEKMNSGSEIATDGDTVFLGPVHSIPIPSFYVAVFHGCPAPPLGRMLAETTSTTDLICNWYA